MVKLEPESYELPERGVKGRLEPVRLWLRSIWRILSATTNIIVYNMHGMMSHGQREEGWRPKPGPYMKYQHEILLFFAITLFAVTTMRSCVMLSPYHNDRDIGCHLLAYECFCSTCVLFVVSFSHNMHQPKRSFSDLPLSTISHMTATWI